MRLLTLSCFLVFFTSLYCQERTGKTEEATPAGTGDAGFREALFDSTTLNGLFKDRSVVALRFYNALAKAGDTNGTAMVVGIRTDGSEVNKGKAYRLSLGLLKGKVQMSNLPASKAATACRDMQAAGHPSYSASFTRTEVEALLQLPGCNALRVTPATDKGQTTMLLTAMKVSGDKAEPLGSEPAYGRLCEYPCPTVCGPAANYVYRADK